MSGEKVERQQTRQKCVEWLSDTQRGPFQSAPGRRRVLLFGHTRGAVSWEEEKRSRRRRFSRMSNGLGTARLMSAIRHLKMHGDMEKKEKEQLVTLDAKLMDIWREGKKDKKKN
ncbi:hypothetical protein B9Z55_019850 [Caenorhabditis nigoni]|uniref:Uncharacterized protein n=1 Tax=Caenorhabditis nigoni TaxID=1611254 RepID=A0A2G5TK75_9PELO|nr:hypothetical protein B9Z55_019850 [Caenorhabditis nigoni]